MSQIYDSLPTAETVDFMKIYHFDNLDYFDNSILNREAKDAKVDEYYKLMKNGDWFFELSPIYVGFPSMKTLNGGHRQEAIRKALKKGINLMDFYTIFIDEKKYPDLKKVITALNTGSGWQIDAYCEREVKNGNPHFIYLRDFCMNEDHPKLHQNKPNYGKAALIFGATYNSFKKDYKSGDFIISEKDKKLAESRYEQIVRIIKALCFPSNDDNWINIAEAWYEISGDKHYMQIIKNLPDGFETFYDKLTEKYRLMGSTKTKIWKTRFIEAIQECYNEMYA